MQHNQTARLFCGGHNGHLLHRCHGGSQHSCRYTLAGRIRLDGVTIADIYKADFNRTFRVLVRSGTAQKIFTLHEDMFFPRSNFFKAARSEAWTTDDGKPVDLTDTTIATFNAHLHCVYLSKVPSVPAMSHTEYQPLSYNEGLMSKLVEIYILTDMLGDFTSANMVVDEIERQCHDIGVTFSVATMHRIYDATIVGSPLRKLLVDQYLREPTHKPIPAAEYPHALLAEIHESYIFVRHLGDWEPGDLENLFECPRS